MSQNYNEYIEQGNSLCGKSKYQEGVESYNKAINLNPNDFLAYNNKGLSLIYLGKYEEAIECYNKAINLNPNYSDAYINKGFSLQNLGQYEEAIECYNKTINLDPKYSDAYYNKGLSLKNLGKNEEAIECYNKSINLNPNNSDTYHNKGISLHNLGKYEEAIECYNKAINLNPNYSDAYYNKGISLVELGKLEKAIECFNKVINLNPKYSNAYNNKGYSLEGLGKYTEAIECYNQVINLNPNDSEAYFKKGYSLYKLGKYDESIECYNKAINLNPNDSLAYNNKGVSLQNLGKYEEAIECYNKTINLDPNYSDAYYNKGLSLQNLGKNEEAIDCYNKAINLNPNYYQAYKSKSFCLDDLGKYEEAIECYNKAINLNPNYSLAYYNKGISLVELGKYDEAIECFNKCINLNPTDVLYLANRAKLHSINGENDLAFKDLKDISKLMKEGEIQGLNQKHKDRIQSILNYQKEIGDEVQKLSEQAKLISRNPQEIQRTQQNTEKFSDLIKQIIEKNSIEKIALVVNVLNKKNVNNESKIAENLDQEANLVNEKVQHVLSSFNDKNSNLEEKNKLLEQEIQFLKEYIKNKFDIIEKDIQDAIIKEQIEVNRKMRELEEGEKEVFNYYKTFYWTSLNMFTAYRNLSTGLIKGNPEDKKFIDNGTLIKEIKTRINEAKGVLKAVPFVESIISEIDEVVGTVAGFITLSTKKISKSSFQKRVYSINQVIQNKFGMEEQISLKLAQIGIKLIELKREQILQNVDEEIKENNMKEWFDDKINSLKKTILPVIELHNENSSGVKFALRDVILMISYMGKEWKQIIGLEKTPFIQIVEDLIKSKRFENQLKNQNTARLKSAPCSCCTVFFATKFKFDHPLADILYRIEKNKISADLIQYFFH